MLGKPIWRVVLLLLGIIVLVGLGWKVLATKVVPKNPALAYIDLEERQLAETGWQVEVVRPVYLGISSKSGTSYIWGLYRDSSQKVKVAKLVLGTSQIPLAPVSRSTGQAVFPENGAVYKEFVNMFQRFEASILTQGSDQPPFDGSVCQRQPRICLVAKQIGNQRLIPKLKDDGRMGGGELFVLGLIAL